MSTETVPPAIDVTPLAIANAKKKLEEAEVPVVGLRVGVKGGGCSGYSYVFDFATKVRPGKDRVFDFDGLSVVVDEKSLEITLEGNVLKLVGRTQDPQMEGYSLRYAEFEPGDFERTFALSSRVDPERISASIKNGVLRLGVPKLQPAQKQIQVKAG